MQIQFLNWPVDCKWLTETHLKGVQGIRPFQSFVIIGNEDAPSELHLYASCDPHYTDPFQKVDLTGGAPVVTDKEGKE